ncbi:PD40 domain-containing protein [Pelomonas sp. V22]|uniref:S41 family peptidase n=1 Tax=Pelomonas sp. V22 TaxID=2822139 RepID=UPI0024A7C827|nr:S41 family peptidase [Pelomonas sp. V22]MDI4631465.1 PD40 domain-containing protein [Pelomonas sp. V22]
MKYRLSALVAALALVGVTQAAQAAEEPTRLLRQPTISATQLAFVYAGDLWIAGRDGSNPRRLTTHAAAEFSPHFSPDGKSIAFSASYDGNTDVYVIPAEGGQPRRLTWHPSADVVSGWSPDGKRVLFASSREVANNRSNQLFEIDAEGGFERKLMEAVAYEGNWSPDGKKLAYRPYRQAYVGTAGWRQSRGGTTPPVWIIDPATNQWEQIPHVNASDTNPVWAGDEVVFISDRNDGAANLFAYNSKTKALRQLTKETVWDVKSVEASGRTVVYEVGGRIKELSLDGGAARDINVGINTASIQARTQWKDAGRNLTSAQLSATGKRVVVSARGDVFTVPVKDGSVRNLTETSGVREKDALWSPDGQRVAYISDAPGMQHQIVLQSQTGTGKPEVLPLPKNGYFSLRDWSPNGQTLVVEDNHLNLYTISLVEGPKRGQLNKIDSSLRRRGSFNAVFSPDSRYLAYAVTIANSFSQVRIADLQTGKQIPVSDGLSHADDPAFSSKGDYLFFTASINAGPTLVGLDMSTQERSVRSGIYAAVLASDGKSPLPPKGGDEDAKKEEAKKPEAAAPAASAASAAKPADKKDEKKDDKVRPVRLDVEGLQQRIVALPVAERAYDSLAVAADGALFYMERRQPGISNELPATFGDASGELYRFDFEERKAVSVRTGLNGYSLSADGKKILLQGSRGRLDISDAKEKLDPKPIDLSGLRTKVDLRAEWKQIFDETWWMEKEYFYDAGLHGLDWDGIYKRYLPLLAHVQRREDLNDLLVEMIGELQVGHNRIGGGDQHSEPTVSVGLLGADFTVESGRYKVSKVLAGDRWSPFMKAPLATPGANVKAGEFILAVNGHQVDAKQNLYSRLENLVGKQVSLTVASDASGKGSREVVVEPIANEAALRQWDWIERNHQYVQQKSGGKVAYVYMPDTGTGGFRSFNRMFFAQVDKQALIVDDRRNGGGQAANYVTELLSRPYLSSWKDRDGLVFDTPGGAIYGPKAMLVDQDAGSGGDFMPYAFKRVGLGPLIGKRTWGGLIGISINPNLIDGGSLVVPYFRFYTPEGEWRIENEGVAPDIDVELDPAAVNKGQDTQLDAAIANVLKRLETWKPIQRHVPPAPATLGK